MKNGEKQDSLFKAFILKQVALHFFPQVKYETSVRLLFTVETFLHVFFKNAKHILSNNTFPDLQIYPKIVFLPLKVKKLYPPSKSSTTHLAAKQLNQFTINEYKHLFVTSWKRMEQTRMILLFIGFLFSLLLL